MMDGCVRKCGCVRLFCVFMCAYAHARTRVCMCHVLLMRFFNHVVHISLVVCP